MDPSGRFNFHGGFIQSKDNDLIHLLSWYIMRGLLPLLGGVLHLVVDLQ
jgi:hypothetical protein